MRKPVVLFFFLLALAAFWTTVPSGCANIIPPSGGPRDSLPPRLLSATPRDSTRNFRGNRITFVFDEFIDDPQDLQNNLVFTPTFLQNPEIAIRAKTMTLRFRDSLQPNTTYTFNFGNAIRDVNEGNVFKNFVYVLSTGPYLDSLTLSGRVTMAENGRADSTLIVMLHRNRRDSAVLRERPIYFAHVDAAGNFRFQNLPRDTFAIYALGNAGMLRTYTQPAQQAFAFADRPVVPGDTAAIQLYAYQVKPPASAATANQPRSAAPASDKRLRFTANTSNGPLDLQSDFVLTFPSPLRSFDSGRVALSTDSTFRPVRFTTLLDSSRTALHFRSAWREGTAYNLILDRDFAEDSAGRKLLKTDTLNFATKKLGDYGRINLRLRNIDTARRPVLFFFQNDQAVFSVSIRGGTFRAPLFNPGEYELRVLYDTNGNGKWDPGQFFGARKQPEIVVPVSRKITVKAAWDNEFDLSL